MGRPTRGRQAGERYTSQLLVGHRFAAMLGSTGVTGSASNGAPSGCTSDGTDFVPSFGLPAPSSGLVDTTALDSSRTQMLLDAMSGSVSFAPDKLPQIKNFDVEGSGTVDDGPTTTTAKVSFHGTLTFTKVS